ncbi:MAG: phosphoribosylglycinamide formyltransferase [Cyanobacteria bacterium P01_E01_bin.42]
MNLISTSEITSPESQNSSVLISPPITSEETKLEQTLHLGVLASGSGSNFEAIAKAIEAGQLNAKIQVLIYNKPKAKAAERAKNLGIPSVLLNHKHYKSREELDRAIVETLQQYQANWVIMAGWMRVVTSTLLDAFPDRAINIHPSLLPSFPGTKAVEQALEAGVKVTGCTVHLVCVEVDSGPILMQAVVPVLPDDTPDTLHARIQVQEHRIFPPAIALATRQ